MAKSTAKRTARITPKQLAARKRNIKMAQLVRKKGGFSGKHEGSGVRKSTTRDSGGSSTFPAGASSKKKIRLMQKKRAILKSIGTSKVRMRKIRKADVERKIERTIGMWN